MSTFALPNRETRSARFTAAKIGRAISALPVLFLTFDTVIKFTDLAPVAESMTQLGWPLSMTLGVGLVELVCLTLYLVPRTSVLGVILLTGYLGGAVASHVRVGNPLFSHILFPVYVAALLWAGLYLREARLRALVPVR
jgi:hypothetical protein